MIKAKKFALKKHKESKSQKDYEKYLNKVYRLIKQKRYSMPKYIGDLPAEEHFPYHKVMQNVAFLHATLSHTNTTYEELVRNFGKRIADIVQLVSDEYDETNREEKIIDVLSKYESFNCDVFEEWAALTFKPVDRYVNWIDAYNNKEKEKSIQYHKEYPAFKKAVYRAGTYKPVWNLLDDLYNTMTKDYY